MTQYIDNKKIEGDGESFNSLDPYKSEIIWQGKSASALQVDLAIVSARNAFIRWKNTHLNERIALLERFVEKIKQSSEYLARIIALETGKPLWEARTEVSAMAAKVAISLSAYNERSGEKRKNNVETGIQTVLRHRPIGVMGVFGPYNFPAHLPNGHIVPALLAGNAVVFKPSQLTPKTAQATMDLWLEAGLPKGLINLIQGGVATAKALAEHAHIDGLLFTGSAATGHILHRQFAKFPDKMLALEMGGNNPMIVTDNYDDLDGVIYSIIQSAFISAGQRCTCARRLYVPLGKKGDQLLSRLIEVTKNIKIGGQFDEPEPFMGSQISIDAAQQIITKQQNLLALGAKALLHGKLLHDAVITPCIIDVTDAKHLQDEEIFGPLLQVTRVHSFEQAILLANDTRYGLSAGLISTDDNQWTFFVDNIRAGIVNRNCPLTGASSDAPFGGVGASGNLRPSAYYAADYCAYPMASMEKTNLSLPKQLSPGLLSAFADN